MAGLREKVLSIFNEWVSIPSKSEKAAFIVNIHSQGLLSSDDVTSRFFQLCTEAAVDSWYSTCSYTAVDAYSKLVYAIVGVIPESTLVKANLINCAVTVAGRSVIKDYEQKKQGFSQQPFFRMFCNWLLDMGQLTSNAGDAASAETFTNALLLSLSNTLYLLQPSRLPGFAFAWLELVSHRTFMPKFLATKSQKGWQMYQQLLVDLQKLLNWDESAEQAGTALAETSLKI